MLCVSSQRWHRPCHAGEKPVAYAIEGMCMHGDVYTDVHAKMRRIISTRTSASREILPFIYMQYVIKLQANVWTRDCLELSEEQCGLNLLTVTI